MQRERKWKRHGKKKYISSRSFTMNATKNDTRFNSSYTVWRQHLTTWQQDSTIFIWNVHSVTVWTLYWYCIVHLYYNQYKILESMAINLYWVSDTICTTTARTCQHDCHYFSLLWLWIVTTIIILRAHLKVTFMANISVSLCELYNSQPALCSQTVSDCMRLQIM
jgi:hypothetical protein